MTTPRAAMASGPREAAAEEGASSPELARVDKEVRAFVKERPVLALLGAIVTGYVLGRVLRRRG